MATGLIAVVTVLALARWGVLPPTSWAAPGTRGRGASCSSPATGAALAVLWEIGEWAGHTFLDPSIHVGYQDTVGDLAAGSPAASSRGSRWSAVVGASSA